MLNALGEMLFNTGNPYMVFDWAKAAQIIRDEQPTRVEAGLAGDWGYTGGVIFEDGRIVEESYTYLSSFWATPQIKVDGEHRDCYIIADDNTEWDAKTKWPAEVRAILSSTEAK